MNDKPDWTTAPKDAQFYSIGSFQKYENGREFYYAGDCWHDIGGYWHGTARESMAFHKGFSDFEMRPESSEPAWDGKGLPPVGTVCESYDADGWQRCVILAVDARGNLVVDLLEDGMVEANHDNDCHSFRPIKSDRDKWADKAIASLKPTLGRFAEEERDICSRIYDALKSGKLPTP